MHVEGIFFDLTKAFEHVNHDILLAELHLYGISWLSEDWFRSYLTKRGLKVEVKSPYTTKTFFFYWGTLKHGVPQVSVLGPLLFIKKDWE